MVRSRFPSKLIIFRRGVVPILMDKNLGDADGG